MDFEELHFGGATYTWTPQDTDDIKTLIDQAFDDEGVALFDTTLVPTATFLDAGGQEVVSWRYEMLVPSSDFATAQSTQSDADFRPSISQTLWSLGGDHVTSTLQNVQPLVVTETFMSYAPPPPAR